MQIALAIEFAALIVETERAVALVTMSHSLLVG